MPDEKIAPPKFTIEAFDLDAPEARLKLTCLTDCKDAPCTAIIEGGAAVELIKTLLMILHKDELIALAKQMSHADDN